MRLALHQRRSKSYDCNGAGGVHACAHKANVSECFMEAVAPRIEKVDFINSECTDPVKEDLALYKRLVPLACKLFRQEKHESCALLSLLPQVLVGLSSLLQCMGIDSNRFQTHAIE